MQTLKLTYHDPFRRFAAEFKLEPGGVRSLHRVTKADNLERPGVVPPVDSWDRDALVADVDRIRRSCQLALNGAAADDQDESIYVVGGGEYVAKRNVCGESDEFTYHFDVDGRSAAAVAVRKLAKTLETIFPR